MGLIKSRIKDQLKCSVVFNNLRQYRHKQIQKSIDEYEWGDPDYKIYPSSLKIGMCVKKHIEGLKTFSGIDNIWGKYAVKRGSAFHEEVQEDYREWGNLCFPNLNGAPQRIVEKFFDTWPEVPFHDLETGISGSADLVIKFKNSDVPVDLKSTNIFENEWPRKKVEELPKPEHIAQIAVYLWEFNKLGYYTNKLNLGILAYKNMLMKPHDQDSEIEFMVRMDKPHPVFEKKGYTETVEELIEELITEVTKCRQQYIDGKEVTCDYKKCKCNKGTKKQ